MKKSHPWLCLLYALPVALLANCYEAASRAPWLLILLIPAFLAVNLLAGTRTVPTASRRLRLCYHGTVLLTVFLVSTAASICYHLLLPMEPKRLLWSALVCVAVEAAVFWNGILCVYLTSVQLGIKQRVVGLVCGIIPVVNLIVLVGIIRTARREVFFETEKEAVDRQRQDQKICATRYPVVMVHGVFFRDFGLVNYWGRIPAALERNGATVFYGEHQSAASIAGSAAELTKRIRRLVEDENCGKVNIIAHSKGGLDCRYAISKLGLGECVASLTTVNTPHRGCIFADHLLTKIPESVQNKVATTYNETLKRLGDRQPDFLAAVNDLTASHCIGLDREMVLPEGIYGQSVGSVIHRARSGTFPMNVSYHLVRHFDGPNDGIVREQAFRWGEKYTLLKPTGRRGISHSDMIDMNRENIPGFDVREFYVNLVADLKDRGL